MPLHSALKKLSIFSLGARSITTEVACQKYDADLTVNGSQNLPALLKARHPFSLN